mmetsp:Transcript_15137/g.26649  ORF Transcript_15137/g.26649 Transcript_15137/m.26649 type:complete len:124 (+) Transcript_15137:4027-4398(+)
MNLHQLASLVLVGALWGSTNSFLKQPQEHVAQEKQHGILKSVITKVIDLFLNWKFTLAFALNQSGSLLYYVLLGATELSMAVPICNATTLLFTVLTARLRGEKIKGNPLCKCSPALECMCLTK